MTDEQKAKELLQRARTGDQEAFGELVQMYHHRVVGVLIGMVHNVQDANDLAQQTWVKAWTRLDSFQERSGFFTWLYRIATRVCLDFIRKRKRQAEIDYEEELEPVREYGAEPAPSLTSRPDREVERDEIKKAFFASLETLSAEHKMALMLREVEGMSYEKIAKVMKCRKGTVMSRIYYARKALQEAMKDLR